MSARLCAFHENWATRTDQPDEYLYRKIVLVLLQPVDTYLNPTQINAVFRGRRHDDGRALDAYTLPDPIEDCGFALPRA